MEAAESRSEPPLELVRRSRLIFCTRPGEVSPPGGVSPWLRGWGWGRTRLGQTGDWKRFCFLRAPPLGVLLSQLFALRIRAWTGCSSSSEGSSSMSSRGGRELSSSSL